MIRMLLAIVFVVLFLLISYPIFFVEWLIGRSNKKKKDESSLHIVQWAIRVVLKICGVRITVKGKENIPEVPALYVANHRSIFDVLVLYVQCTRLTGFVSKDVIEKIPSLRVWMRYLYCIFLDRKDPRSGMKMILQAIEQIKQGISICIFPEGTRNKGEEGTILPFKEGSFKIATKTGCPIVPVAISNTVEVWEAHLPWIRKTHVIVEYGDPIDASALEKDEQKAIGARCQRMIEEMLKGAVAK
ncbi:MAG: lysophospholipid acyltransferase family protein [Faecalimonas sp.]|nr:lysophospholipid acyltransferase family protein [Faecalimonas sp.]